MSHLKKGKSVPAERPAQKHLLLPLRRLCVKLWVQGSLVTMEPGKVGRGPLSEACTTPWWTADGGRPLVCVSKYYLTVKTLHQLCGQLVIANVRDFCIRRGALDDFPCIFHICGSLTVDSCCCWVNRVLASYRLWLLLLTKTTSLWP